VSGVKGTSSQMPMECKALIPSNIAKHQYGLVVASYVNLRIDAKFKEETE